MSQVRKDSDYEVAVTAALRDAGQLPEPRHRFYSEEPWMLLDDMVGGGDPGAGPRRATGDARRGGDGPMAAELPRRKAAVAEPSVTRGAELVVVQVCHRGRPGRRSIRTRRTATTGSWRSSVSGGPISSCRPTSREARGLRPTP